MNVTVSLKHLSNKKLLQFLAVLSFSCVLLSCGSRESYVKKSRLEFDSSVKIGRAFSGYDYFKKVKWDSFKDKQGRKIIEVECEIDLDAILGNPDHYDFERMMKNFIVYNNVDKEKQYKLYDDISSDVPTTKLINAIIDMREGRIDELLNNQKNFSTDELANQAASRIKVYKISEYEEDILSLIVEGDIDGARELRDITLTSIKLNKKKTKIYYVCQFTMMGRKDFEVSGNALRGTIAYKSPKLSESFFQDLGGNTDFLRYMYKNKMPLLSFI